jgi:hypothetical protein
MIKPNTAESALREMQSIIGRRGKDYGECGDNFKRIASLWSEYKGVEFSKEEVAVFFMLAKIARLAQTPGHKDSLLDIGGYAALAIEAEQEPFDPVKDLDRLRGRKNDKT